MAKKFPSVYCPELDGKATLENAYEEFEHYFQEARGGKSWRKGANDFRDGDIIKIYGVPFKVVFIDDVMNFEVIE